MLFSDNLVEMSYENRRVSYSTIQPVAASNGRKLRNIIKLIIALLGQVLFYGENLFRVGTFLTCGNIMLNLHFYQQ